MIAEEGEKRRKERVTVSDNIHILALHKENHKETLHHAK